MPRRGYYNNLDTPVVQYIPGFNEDIAQAQLSQVADINKRWEDTEQAVANAIAEYGSLPVSDYDRPTIQNKIADFNKYVQDTVGKYGGRYDLAAGDIARKMANDAQIYSVAKQRYDLEKQYAPMYAKYAQNLLFKDGDPRKKAIFDEQGNYVGMPDFTPYERSDYSKVFREDVGKLIDDMVYEGKLQPSQKAGYLETITKKGIAAIDNPELQRRLSAYVPEFQAKTTFGFDPELQQYKERPLDFLNKLATYGTTGGLQRQFQSDREWELMREASEYNRRRGLESQQEAPKLTRLYSTSTLGDKVDLDSTPFTGDSFNNLIKKDLLKTKWKNKEGNIDPKLFEETLNSFVEKPWGSYKTNAPAYNLKEAIVKDEAGKIDVDASIANIEKLANQQHTASIGKIPSKTAATNFLTQMNKYVKDKVGEKFGDYGVDVMGFDMTDKTSFQTYDQMNNYINQISPDVFNFETGKFSDIKTKKLSKNEDFLKARQDNKFKIQGVIKTPSGVKFIAEDGSGEPQVISSSNDVVNKQLLRMFGDPTLIGSYSYRNYKLSPSGNTVGLGDEKVELPEGYRVDKQPNGKYLLIDKNNVKSNRLFDKWEILNTFGFKPE